MTSDKLYGILTLLENLDSQLGIQPSLEAVGNALTSLASQPAQAQHQNALAQALSSFEAAVAQLRTSISPSQMTAIKAMGGGEYFDPSIADKVKSAILQNPMTPSVARDFVQDFATKRATFLNLIRTARQSLAGLKTEEATLEPGTADLAFLIPREIFENKLGPFAKELTFINRLIEHYSEAIMNEVQPVELEQLSSSVPTIALAVAPPVILAIATIVDKFLGVWEKIERIRKIRAELVEVGMKKSAVEELDEEITTKIDEVVEESTVLVLSNYKGDGSRKSELETGVRQVTKRLLGQIERGLTIEFRAKPDGDSEDEDAKRLENIENLGKLMKFPEITTAPMLLGSGEVLEGDIAFKHAKKTTKATTTKKETHKQTTQET